MTTAEHRDSRAPDHFIPLGKREITRMLVADSRLDTAARDMLERVAARLALLFHIDLFPRREALKDLYARFNPDQSGDAPLPADPFARDTLFEVLEETLVTANYHRLTEADLASARDSQGRVQARVRIRQNVFADVRFYARGLHRRRIEVARWFGLRRVPVETEVFHDIVLAAAIRRDADRRELRGTRLRPGAVYLKLFRDIPRADVMTLYPDARVLMRLTDQLLIGVPALVGGVPVLLNLAPALGVLMVVGGAYLGISGTVEDDSMKQALGALSGLGALGGFLGRQWIKYERQKLKYQKQVSDNAYFNNLGNNTAFFDTIVGASEDSEVKEALLAYGLLALTGTPERRPDLDARIERWLAERFAVRVDFEIDDAVAKLERFGLVRREGDLLRAIPMPDALDAIDAAILRVARGEEAAGPGCLSCQAAAEGANRS